MYRTLALSVLLHSGVAIAGPQVDVFDSDMNYQRSINLQGIGSQLVTDIEVGPDNHVWVLLSGSNIPGSQCRPDNVIKRFDASGNLVATFKGGLKRMGGFAINPAGGVWATGTADCEPSSGAQAFRIDASDNVVAIGSNHVDGMGDIDLLPTGRLVTGSWYDLMTLDATTMQTLTAETRDRYRVFEIIYNEFTDSILVPSTRNGPGNSSLSVFSSNGTFQSGTDLAELGIQYPRDAAALSTGEVVLFRNDSPNEVSAVYLSSGYDSVSQTVPTTISRRTYYSVTRDANDNIYLGVNGPDPIETENVTLSDIYTGNTTSLVVSYTTPADIQPGDSIEVRMGTGLDITGISPEDAEIVAGLDGSLTYSLTRQSGNEVGLSFVRSGGSVIPAGTNISMRLNGIVNPGYSRSVAVNRIIHKAGSNSDWIAESRSELSALSIREPLICVVGQPYDADADGLPDYCRGTSALISPDAVIEPRAQVGDAFIGRGAVIGERAVIHDGAVIGARALVGTFSTVGAGSVVGRGATIGAGATLGADVLIGRSAVVGRGITLPTGSSIGYAAQVGESATFGGTVTLGPLAVLGGNRAGRGAIQCAGNLTIARASRVAAESPYTLTCLGSLVVGPNSVIGTGAVVGDGTRIRKDARIGNAFNTGEGVRVGRDADFGHRVAISANGNTHANVRLCDDAAASGSLPRDHVHQSCLIEPLPSWQNTQLLANNVPLGTSQLAATEVLSDGGLITAWSSGESTQARYFNPDTGFEAVHTFPVYGQFPALIEHDDGTVVSVWSTGSASSNWMSVFDAATGWSAPQIIYSGEDAGPARLAVTNSGYTVVALRSQNGSGTKILFVDPIVNGVINVDPWQVSIFGGNNNRILGFVASEEDGTFTLHAASYDSETSRVQVGESTFTPGDPSAEEGTAAYYGQYNFSYGDLNSSEPLPHLDPEFATNGSDMAVIWTVENDTAELRAAVWQGGDTWAVTSLSDPSFYVYNARIGAASAADDVFLVSWESYDISNPAHFDAPPIRVSNHDPVNGWQSSLAVAASPGGTGKTLLAPAVSANGDALMPRTVRADDNIVVQVYERRGFDGPWTLASIDNNNGNVQGTKFVEAHFLANDDATIRWSEQVDSVWSLNYVLRQ